VTVENRSIAWVTPHGGFAPELYEGRLRDFGFHVIACPIGESRKASADLRVLPADSFRDTDALDAEYKSDSRPTVILASSAEQALAACDFANERDEIAQSGEPPQLLARRLALLAKRSIGVELSHALQRQPSADPLTGLLNRKGFADELAKCMCDHLPGETKGVMVFDLDHFKQINDAFGHEGGNAMLVELAAVLQREAAPADRFARMGGDEFACLLARYDEQTVSGDAQKILERIRSHVFPLGEGTGTTASAGLVFLQSQAGSTEALRQADLAMYEAKRNGGDRLVTFEGLRDATTARDEDLHLRNFENVVRVVNERVSGQITQLARRLLEVARREANEDPVTGLNNRRYFDARIAREIEIARRQGRALTIALMDLDEFGKINKEFRWPTGDRVLRHFAETAKASVRLVDWLARYGGEEFCLVMPDTDLQTGCMVAERVRMQIATSVVESLDKGQVRVTVSIGVAQLTGDVQSSVALVDKAAKALKECKSCGKNRTVAARDDGDADTAFCEVL
jgi:two-component system cell cycle response regulator